jgi:hypothetical protein
MQGDYYIHTAQTKLRQEKEVGSPLTLFCIFSLDAWKIIAIFNVSGGHIYHANKLYLHTLSWRPGMRDKKLLSRELYPALPIDHAICRSFRLVNCGSSLQSSRILVLLIVAIPSSKDSSKPRIF